MCECTSGGHDYSRNSQGSLFNSNTNKYCRGETMMIHEEYNASKHESQGWL